jgi:hypothetical protein
MSVPSVPVSGAQSATVLVRLAGHTERLRADSLDADGFVLRTRVLVPGVWTTATLEPTEAVRVRVGVIAGAVDASGRQRFTVAEAADEPLLRLVGTLISARVTDIADVPPATILPPSVTVLPFVPPAPR